MTTLPLRVALHDGYFEVQGWYLVGSGPIRHMVLDDMEEEVALFEKEEDANAFANMKKEGFKTSKVKALINSAAGIIELADERAMAVDGPVPPTLKMLSPEECQSIFTLVWEAHRLGAES